MKIPTGEELLAISTPLLAGLLATGRFTAPTTENGDEGMIVTADKKRVQAVEVALDMAVILALRCGGRAAELERKQKQREQLEKARVEAQQVVAGGSSI